MDMSTLPPPDTMARVVSGVTETMLGLTFRAASGGQPWNELVWRSAVLPIPGARPLTVGLSSDQPGCVALAAKMFQLAPGEVADDMLSDALCELVNMTAGLLKANLKLEQALGLPRVVPSGQAPVPTPPPQTNNVVLRAAEVGLVLWVFEGIA
jgi:chemotaxis phosphatase CheX-like protein